MKRNRRHPATGPALISGAALLVGLAAGSATAAYNAAHDNIILKDPDGNKITSLNSGNNAFSIKTTCFGTAGCHGDQAASGTLKYTYDEIERHSYHALNGSNELRGFNAWNPDGVLPNGQPDPVRRGVNTQGKNWVQGPAHVGSW
ncbi:MULTISPECIES: cytochrome C [Geobacter]|uniref:cytochrome C n=1 Tax=Geobacter TaxID=28231 RepID=UPI0025743F71|nr:cytochrome C [Geobacter sulfurreducens]BEH11742.1 cytochrome c [Geobacter sulfurreducens subsp. ethanolicus]BET59602.1 cytochrome c [Geobacter sp. 60473]HML77039.1 cytochrome C [Geobacter sulfurreducens]